jgi:hypothetical protein
MLTGLFANTGIYIGGRAHQPTISNPKGYFETKGINNLNNRIIEDYLRWPIGESVRRRWSSNIHTDVRAYAYASPRRLHLKSIKPSLQNAIRYYGGKQDFCYKDPRFCVTLPVWRESLDPSVRHLVVFREPEKIIASFIKNGKDIYTPPLEFNGMHLEYAFARNYSRLMEWADETWMFVHYDQVISGEIAPDLERFCNLELGWSHVEKALRRTSKADYVCRTSVVDNVYRQLCRLANYQ